MRSKQKNDKIIQNEKKVYIPKKNIQKNGTQKEKEEYETKNVVYNLL